MRHVAPWIGILLLCHCGAIQADQVVLTNGDRLSGKIVSLVEGKMTFTADMVGEVTIPLTDIRTFASDTDLDIHLKDGTILVRKVSTAPDNQFSVAGSDMISAQTIKVADITAINPPAKPKPRWTGHLSAGWTSIHGNTTADTRSLSFRATKRTDKDRLTVSGDYVRSRQVDPATNVKNTTEDWWRAQTKYNYYFTPRWFGYLDGRYEKDSIAQLDRRVLIGAGGGWQWIETERTNISFELGLASLYEKFDNQAGSNSELTAQVGYNIDHKFTRKIHLRHDLTYYPAMDKLSDYYLTTTGSLRADLTDRTFVDFKTIFSYDSTPAPGQGGTDVKYILGVGLDF